MGTKTSSMFLKTISLLIAAIFLWNQIAWAGDFPLDPSDQTYQEQIPGTTADDLSEREAKKQSLVDMKNTIENFINYPDPDDFNEGQVDTYNDPEDRLETRQVVDQDPESDFYGQKLEYEYNNEPYYTDPSTGRESGRINKVSIYNKVEQTTTGTALTFNGTDDHVDLGSDASLDFGTNDFTISAWVRTAVTDNNEYMIYSGITNETDIDFEIYKKKASFCFGGVR